MGGIRPPQSRILTPLQSTGAGILRATLIKPAIFALLAVNAIIFATTGRASEGVDALAWFALLALFEVETRWPHWTHTPRYAAVLALAR